WGFHGWGLYATIGLILAYFKFRQEAPGLISATLEPFFGKKWMRGSFGKIIDTLAIFATVVGVASTLGFGSSHINSGIQYLFNSPDYIMTKIVILLVDTGLFILSALSRLGVGINVLCTTNLWIAAALVLTLVIVIPSVYILDMFMTSICKFVGNFFEMG